MTLKKLFAAIFVLGIIVAVAVWSLDPFTGGNEGAEAQNGTFAVKRGTLKITLTERGTFQARKSTNVRSGLQSGAQNEGRARDDRRRHVALEHHVKIVGRRGRDIVRALDQQGVRAGHVQRRDADIRRKKVEEEHLSGRIDEPPCRVAPRRCRSAQ